MASTYTRDVAVGYVRSDLAAKGAKFYDDAEIVRQLNAAFVQFHADMKVNQSSEQATSVIGQHEYAWPDRCLEINRITFNNVNLVIRSIDWLNRRNPSWMSVANSTPTLAFINPRSTYGFFPAPDVATANIIRVYGIYVPALPASGSATYDLPSIYEQAHLALACSYVARKDIEGFGAEQNNVFQQEYERLIATYRQAAWAGQPVIVGGNAHQDAGLRYPQGLIPSP